MESRAGHLQNCQRSDKDRAEQPIMPPSLRWAVTLIPAIHLGKDRDISPLQRRAVATLTISGQGRDLLWELLEQSLLTSPPTPGLSPVFSSSLRPAWRAGFQIHTHAPISFCRLPALRGSSLNSLTWRSKLLISLIHACTRLMSNYLLRIWNVVDRLLSSAQSNCIRESPYPLEACNLKSRGR